MTDSVNKANYLLPGTAEASISPSTNAKENASQGTSGPPGSKLCLWLCAAVFIMIAMAIIIPLSIYIHKGQASEVQKLGSGSSHQPSSLSSSLPSTLKSTLKSTLPPSTLNEVPSTEAPQYVEVCEGESFRAECKVGEVIKILSAAYGRMAFGRCIHSNLGHIGCTTDVLELADARCSGKQTCEIHFPDDEFAAKAPCPRDLKNYFKAGYVCTNGSTLLHQPTTTHQPPAPHDVEICQWESFRAECQVGEVIKILSAAYGRMAIGRCVPVDYGYVGCSTDVLELADARCSGRQTCEISVPDDEFAAKASCPKELRNYFKAGYVCTKGSTLLHQPTTTHQPTNHKVANKDQITREFCEGETFRAECKVGEVIVMHEAAYGRMRLGRCVRTDLGFVGCSTDVLSLADKRCSGRQTCEIRVPDPDFDATKPCYEELTVYLAASYYCTKVVGCPAIEAPRHGWVKRNGTRAIIGCESSDKTSHLVCKGTEWLGKVPICTPDVPESVAVGGVTVPYNVPESLAVGGVTVPYTFCILIIMGVLIMTGIYILTIYLHRQRARRSP